MLGVGFCALLLLPASSSAQGLGDVAREEKERRRKEAGPARSYSNTDLPDRPAEDSEEVPTSPTPGGARADAPAKSDERAPGGGSEAAWRARATATRRHLEATRKKAADLEKQGATPGLVVKPVPCLRMEGAGERPTECYETSGSDPLAKARSELEGARKAVRKLEESARRAGVPQSWIR
jgi:hypothetical protein